MVCNFSGRRPTPPKPAVGCCPACTHSTHTKNIRSYIDCWFCCSRWFATPQGDVPPTQPAVGWTNAMTSAGCPGSRLCYWDAVKVTLREVSIHLSDLPGECSTCMKELVLRFFLSVGWSTCISLLAREQPSPVLSLALKLHLYTAHRGLCLPSYSSSHCTKDATVVEHSSPAAYYLPFYCTQIASEVLKGHHCCWC